MKKETRTSARKSRNLPLRTSKQQLAAKLLTEYAPYSDSNTRRLRELTVPVVTNGTLSGVELITAVRMSVLSLKSVTTQPLELADLITAFAVMYPNEIACILQGLRESCTRHDKHAEGLAVGALEAVSSADVPRKEGLNATLKFLGYVLGGELWIGGECLTTSVGRSRLSTGLSRVFESSLWIEGRGSSDMLSLMPSMSDHLHTELKRAIDYPKTLHDYLVNEIVAKMFLSAPPYYRVRILNFGLRETIRGREEELECTT